MWMLPPSVTSAAARGVKSKICKKRRRKGQKKDGGKRGGEKKSEVEEMQYRVQKRRSGPSTGDRGGTREIAAPRASCSRLRVNSRPIKIPMLYG